MRSVSEESTPEYASPEPKWGTVRAAARRFGISRETLGRAIRRGEIPAYVLPGHGRWRRVCFADVEEHRTRVPQRPLAACATQLSGRSGRRREEGLT